MFIKSPRLGATVAPPPNTPQHSSCSLLVTGNTSTEEVPVTSSKKAPGSGVIVHDKDNHKHAPTKKDETDHSIRKSLRSRIIKSFATKRNDSTLVEQQQQQQQKTEAGEEKLKEEEQKNKGTQQQEREDVPPEEHEEKHSGSVQRSCTTTKRVKKNKKSTTTKDKKKNNDPFIGKHLILTEDDIVDDLSTIVPLAFERTNSMEEHAEAFLALRHKQRQQQQKQPSSEGAWDDDTETVVGGWLACIFTCNQCGYIGSNSILQEEREPQEEVRFPSSDEFNNSYIS
jgi:hypothetical protein